MAQGVSATQMTNGTGPAASGPRQILRKAIPYLATAVMFGIIFRLIPIAEVVAALREAPLLRFFGVFLPFCVFYWTIDSLCLTWVISRFNTRMRLREMMPIRASMYLLSMINTNLGQGGVAWYVHRKAGVPFLQVLSSILLVGLMEIYQLVIFSTLGVIFYHPASARQVEIVHVLRLAYVIAWIVLGAVISIFALARHSERVRGWIESSRFGAVAGTFLAARPLDYAMVLGIKSPGFLGSLLAQHFALVLYGVPVPLIKLVLFLPLVFMAAALPIGVAHLGTSQAAWILFFAGSASQARILAYSLAAHFTFMFCNGLIGLFFLPRASRDLMAVRYFAD